jgi:hypothetical protein
MWHAIELTVILFVVCAAQAALDVAPHAARRTVWSFLGLCAAFAVGIAVLSSRSVADPVVRLGIAALIAYMLRWLVTGAVDYLRGPMLMEPARAVDLAAAAERAAGLGPRAAMRAARRMLRSWEGEIALAALARIGPAPEADEAAFVARWEAACAPALEEARRTTARFSPSGGEGRVSVAGLRFVSQALCLYRRESMERALGRLKGLDLSRHSGRMRAGEELGKSATRNGEMERLGLLPPACEPERPSATAFSAAAVFWPAAGLARVGFRARAWALGCSEALLLAYGVLAICIDRDSWLVFLAVGVLIHIQAAMALGDFSLSTASPEAGAAGEKKA